jgi:hypothetical protein
MQNFIYFKKRKKKFGHGVGFGTTMAKQLLAPKVV